METKHLNLTFSMLEICFHCILMVTNRHSTFWCYNYRRERLLGCDKSRQWSPAWIFYWNQMSPRTILFGGWVSDVNPTRGSSIFYWFQTSPAEVRPRSQTPPLMSCSPVRSSQKPLIFSTKSHQKIEIVPQKPVFCYYNTSIDKLWLVF